MTIEVSVMSSCFKMKNYLKIFLEALPQQTLFKNIELVLDHHEPTKKEIELVKNFQKKYPGKLNHFINKSVIPLYSSWNRCIKNSKGKYLAIWNVDDLRTENSLELQYNIIKNDNVGFVYGNYTSVKKFGSKNGIFINHKKFNKSELIRSMLLGPFYMFKKSLCNKIGFFDEQFKVAADFDFAIRLALESKGKMVKQNLGYYLNNQRGLSTRPNSLQPIEKDQVCFRYGIFDKIEKRNIPYLLDYNVKSFLYQKKYFPITKFYKKYNQFIKEKIYKIKIKKKYLLWG